MHPPAPHKFNKYQSQVHVLKYSQKTNKVHVGSRVILLTLHILKHSTSNFQCHQGNQILTFSVSSLIKTAWAAELGPVSAESEFGVNFHPPAPHKINQNQSQVHVIKHSHLYPIKYMLVPELCCSHVLNYSTSNFQYHQGNRILTFSVSSRIETAYCCPSTIQRLFLCFWVPSSHETTLSPSTLS